MFFFFFISLLLDELSMCEQFLAGLTIFIGIPFPIWMYYKGEGMRARNPLTKGSTLPKKDIKS